jgi:hypothetical protein
MNEILSGIIFIAFALSFFSFGIGIYMNLWIYYSTDKNKYPLFPILNPFSFSSYELMLNSMFKISWKVENPIKNLKQKSNNLRKFSGIMLLITVALGILSLIIS